MKKLFLGFVLAVGVLGGGWVAVREKLAQDNASQYLTRKCIPSYHELSFHSPDDSNFLGYCRPCGDKAKAVLAGKVDAAVDAERRKLDEALGGGRK